MSWLVTALWTLVLIVVVALWNLFDAQSALPSMRGIIPGPGGRVD